MDLLRISEVNQEQAARYRVYWITEEGQAREMFLHDRRTAEIFVGELESQGLSCGFEVLKTSAS